MSERIYKQETTPPRPENDADIEADNDRRLSVAQKLAKILGDKIDKIAKGLDSTFIVPTKED